MRDPIYQIPVLGIERWVFDVARNLRSVARLWSKTAAASAAGTRRVAEGKRQGRCCKVGNVRLSKD